MSIKYFKKIFHLTKKRVICQPLQESAYQIERYTHGKRNYYTIYRTSLSSF